MSTRITAPVPDLNKVGVGGLTFVDSVAFTDNPALIAYCERAGYLVEADAKPEKLTGAALDKALDEADLPKDGTADEKRARLDESRLL